MARHRATDRRVHQLHPDAKIARASTSGPPFAAFQAVTALLLVAAGASAFQAGPGLLKELAREEHPEDDEAKGILPS